MKIRTDFVSNSSSSSFMLMGCTYGELEPFLKELFKNEPDLMKQYDEGELDTWEEIDKRIVKPLTWEHGGYDGEITEVAIGLDPDDMKDDETLKQFKQRAKDALDKMGLNIELKDIKFISGGSDASGSSWIESCG